MDATSTTYRASRDVILTELGDGMGVLLHLGTKFYYTLNATGVTAWKALDAGATREDVADAIARAFRVDSATAARDVEPILTEMLDEGLIAPTE
jgi:hypothetical protein